jgi:hypothetical protein
MSQSVIEATGTFCIDDVARSKFLGVLGQSRLFPWIVAVVALLSIAFIAFETASGSAHGNTVPAAFLIVIFVYFLSAATYRQLRDEFTVRRYFRDPVTYVFTPETIGMVGTGLSSTVAWSNLVRVRETASLFLLYIGPKGAVIVPKRFFQSPEEIEKWRQLVASSVDPKLIEKPSFFGRWC